MTTNETNETNCAATIDDVPDIETETDFGDNHVMQPATVAVELSTEALLSYKPPAHFKCGTKYLSVCSPQQIFVPIGLTVNIGCNRYKLASADETVCPPEIVDNPGVLKLTAGTTVCSDSCAPYNLGADTEVSLPRSIPVRLYQHTYLKHVDSDLRVRIEASCNAVLSVPEPKPNSTDRLFNSLERLMHSFEPFDSYFDSNCDADFLRSFQEHLIGTKRPEQPRPRGRGRRSGRAPELQSAPEPGGIRGSCDSKSAGPAPYPRCNSHSVLNL